MMLDTALLKRPAGPNGSPGGKESTVYTSEELMQLIMRFFLLCTTFLLLYLLLQVSDLLTDALLHGVFAHAKVT